MSVGEKGLEGNRRKEEDKVLRDGRGKWRIEESIHWKTAGLRDRTKSTSSGEL